MLIIAFLFPMLAGCLLIGIAGINQRVRQTITEGLVLVTSALIWCCLLLKPASATLFSFQPELTLTFALDDAGRIFLSLISILWPLATLYAFEYMHHEERDAAFFVFYLLSYGATIAVALSGSLFTLYVFYELLTLVTLPLVIHKFDSPSALAGRRYLTYSITGAAMAFMALAALIHFAGDTTFVPGGMVAAIATPDNSRVLLFTFLLAFIGFGTKAAIYPMHAWLPYASVAPTPVTALLHAVAVVNTGAFSVIRLIYYSFGVSFLRGTWVQGVCVALASFTIIYASCMAVKETHLKRRLVYSTVSNLSYMLLGASLMTDASLTGSLTHMIMHSVIKITLFFCCGAMLVYTGKQELSDLRGLQRVMPFTTAVFTIASVALVGVPPLCGYAGKWQLLLAASSIGGWMGYVGMFALIVSAVLTPIYLLQVSFGMYFRPKSAALPEKRCDPKLAMTTALCILLVLLLLLSFTVPQLLNKLSAITAFADM